MMLDQQLVYEYLEHLADKYTAAELIEVLEDMGLVSIRDILAAFEDQLLEAREQLT